MSNNNISLNISEREKFTINGNEDKFIMINPKDMGVMSRLSDAIPICEELVKKYESTMSSDDSDIPIEEAMRNFSVAFNEIDSQLRDVVNTLFDYDVCSVCADGGSMLDLQDGEYRFVVIIDTLMQVYQDNISEETNKMIAKMKKRTEKYTAQDRKKRQRKS